MRKIVVAVGTTLTGLVLVLSWPTSTNRPVLSGAGTTAGTGTAAAPVPAPAPAAAPAPVPGDDGEGEDSAAAKPAPAPVVAAPAPATAVAPAPAKSAASGTFDGGTAQTQWGPVQVRIEVVKGTIRSAQAIQVPSGNGRDQQINSYAIPILNAAVVQAQSASIQMVSGATITSGGYLQSLQDALNQASR